MDFGQSTKKQPNICRKSAKWILGSEFTNLTSEFLRGFMKRIPIALPNGNRPQSAKNLPRIWCETVNSASCIPFMPTRDRRARVIIGYRRNRNPPRTFATGTVGSVPVRGGPITRHTYEVAGAGISIFMVAEFSNGAHTRSTYVSGQLAATIPPQSNTSPMPMEWSAITPTA